MSKIASRYWPSGASVTLQVLDFNDGLIALADALPGEVAVLQVLPEPKHDQNLLLAGEFRGQPLELVLRKSA